MNEETTVPTDTDFIAMSYEDQADWLAAHFTACGLPARAVAMGGPCYSAQIAIVLDGDRRCLNLQWEETLRWQLEDPETIEYLDEGALEDLTPSQSASRVWSWLSANGAKVAPTSGPPSPSAADLEAMSEQARADWLASRLAADGIPCEAVGMGGSAVSVEVPVAFDDVPYRLYLAWEDGILWQVEPRDGGEVLEHGLWWDLTPEESTDHVRDWLISRGGRLALTGLDSARPGFYSSTSPAADAAVAHSTDLLNSSRPSPPPQAAPATALRRLADRLAEDATPAEVEQVLREVLDPEHGILGALTEVTAAATDWVRARVTFDDPHHNPGFAQWMRLNGCTSMLAEIHHDLRQAPQEAAALPLAPVASNHPEFLQRRRGTTSITTREPTEPSVLSAPGAMDSYDQYKEEQATARQRAARASSPTAGSSATPGARLNSPTPAPQPGPTGRTPRTR